MSDQYLPEEVALAEPAAYEPVVAEVELEAPALEVVPEPEVAPEPVVEVVEVVEVAAEPEHKTVTAKSKKNSKSFSGENIYLDKLVFNSLSRNSQSVKNLQDRLKDLGYADVSSDKYGWLSVNTKAAIASYQKEIGLEPSGNANKDTIEALFEGTKIEII